MLLAYWLGLGKKTALKQKPPLLEKSSSTTNFLTRHTETSHLLIAALVASLGTGLIAQDGLKQMIKFSRLLFQNEAMAIQRALMRRQVVLTIIIPVSINSSFSGGKFQIA
jgi:hypothetical protein